jgi:hypothetical protein
MVTFTNDKMQIEGYDQRNKEYQIGTLRVRKNTDEWERKETKKENSHIMRCRSH